MQALRGSESCELHDRCLRAIHAWWLGVVRGGGALRCARRMPVEFACLTSGCADDA